MYCDGNPLAMVGNIPAYAGNTLPSHGCKRTSRDHPRLRGEHILVESGDVRSMGSSPLARGTRTHPGRERGRPFDGIIPACAGNTHCRRRASHRRWDHPRLRGEHLPLIASRSWPKGSSPLARGTQQGSVLRRGPRRIIPACAGNTMAAGIAA